MKKNLALLLILITTIIFAQAGGVASAAPVVKDPVVSTIETNATSQLEVAPDIAYINAVITIVNEVKDVSYNTNKTSANNLVNALIAAGIDKKDIKTTSFYASAYIDKVVVDPQATNPVYKDVKKYQTTSNFKITIKNVDNVGNIIDKMLNVDNVDISNVTYGIANVTNFKKEVIKEAVNLAKENISFSAEAANVKLDKLQGMTIDFNNNPYTPYPVYAKAMQSADSTPMYQNPENIKISATVHMVYTTK
jgi:uncharacterized protein YggE